MGEAVKFSEILRTCRELRGLTQEQLASAAAMSVAAIRDLEQGRRQRPRPGSLTRLAAALNLAPSQAEELVRVCRSGDPMASRGASLKQGPGLRLRIFGTLTASLNESTEIRLGPPRQRAVLGLLALNANHPVHRETIIDTLWGAEPPSTATSLVQGYISRLRRVLVPEHACRERTLLDSVGSSYRLMVSDSELDLLEFRQLSARASRATEAGDEVAAFRLYEQAMEVWRGTLLADVEMLRGHIATAEVSAERSAVLLRYAMAAVCIGRHDRVLPHLRVLTRLEPLNEPAHAHLMLVLAGLGQQAAALSVYQDLRQRLDVQLGVRPGPQLAAAHLRVLRQEIPAARL